VRDLEEVFTDPQLTAREMIASVEHATIGALQVLGVPVKLSATPGSVRSAPPTLGQHTDAVLRDDLGLSAAQIAALREQQAI
jgi:crotonobetainyl-CoA:carnitine CoA-transferase CaiB-like acyl-CoA transferase